MRKVIRINPEEKPVEFTHYLDENDGWVETNPTPDQFNQIVYLGRCYLDGDMFAAYDDNLIVIYKGHLNSGKY